MIAMPDPSPPGSVDKLQRWMFDAVSHPGGLDAGLAAAGVPPPGLEAIVLPSETLPAFDRLEIYADMYFLRLVEILAAEYPTVRHLIGPDVFDAQCRLFLQDHPSRSYQLTRLSAAFPAWLAARPARSARPAEHAVRHQAFAADVAQVERAMEEVFDAPAQPPIPPETVAAIPPDQWPDTVLTVIEAHQLLTLDHPVNDYITATKEGRHADVPSPTPTQPGGDGHAEPGKAHCLVWRQGWQVWRKDHHPAQHAILTALAAGAALGDAVQTAVQTAAQTAVQTAAADLPGTDPAWLIAKLGEWFQQWSADGLFCGVHPPS